MNSDPQLSPLACDPQSLLVPAPAADAPAEHGGVVKSHGKATNREVNDRVHQVAMMLARRVAKFRIKRFMREKYGIKARQSESYLSRAKAHLRERAGRDRKEIFAEIFASYESMIADPESDDRVRLECLRAMREMFGCDAPRKVTATTPDGESAAPLVNLNIDRLTIEQRHFLLGIAMSMEPQAAGGKVALPEADVTVPYGDPGEVVEVSPSNRQDVC